MSGTGDLGGLSLFELFKAEAETHCALLNEGLLAIEQTPDDLARLEPLMRAAHSIKGAARIIGLDLAVTLAHAMEDCLVGAQKGRERLGPARIDQLLRGVDILAQLAQATEADLGNWAQVNGTKVNELVAALAAPPPALPARAEPAGSETPSASPPPSAQLPEKARSEEPAATDAKTEAAAIRVSATNLDRILRLASESLVEAGRFKTLRRLLTNMKQVQRRLDLALQDAEARGAHVQQRTAALNEARRLQALADRQLLDHATELEQVFRRSEELSNALYRVVLGSRMRPFSDGMQSFPRMIRDLARDMGKRVHYELVGARVAVDRDILQQLEAPLTHMLRNSVDHGVESPDERRAAGKPEQATIVLEARHHAGMLTVQVRDDGRGIDLAAVSQRIIERRLTSPEVAAKLTRTELLDFLFLPNFSTKSAVTEVSGRGVGLDVVRAMVQTVGGTVQVDSEFGRGTTFTLRLPVTRSVVRAALVEIAGELYAAPLSRLERIVAVPRSEVQPVEGCQQFMLSGQSVGLIQAAEVLQLGHGTATGDALNVLVIGHDGKPCGLVVDRFCGEQDLVVRPLDPRLGDVPHLAAAAVLENGDPVLVIDTEDLLSSMKQMLGEGRLRGMAAAAEAAQRTRRRVLVVDDSITVREVERQLLSRQGYDVDVAVDGREGWNALRAGSYDLLVTDVDMPRMNGIELIRAVRRDARFTELPIIIVSYKEREEDRLLGMEAGASAYLTKGSFHDDSLIKTVTDLIGAAS